MTNVVVLVLFSVTYLGFRVSVTFHLLFIHIILVLFRLLSGQRLRRSCSLGWPYVLFVYLLFAILVISYFSFEGGIWVQIASVSGHCIPFTLNGTAHMGRCLAYVRILPSIITIFSHRLACIS